MKRAEKKRSKGMTKTTENEKRILPRLEEDNFRKTKKKQETVKKKNDSIK